MFARRNLNTSVPQRSMKRLLRKKKQERVPQICSSRKSQIVKLTLSTGETVSSCDTVRVRYGPPFPPKELQINCTPVVVHVGAAGRGTKVKLQPSLAFKANTQTFRHKERHTYIVKEH